MKITYLNTWGARKLENYIHFLEEHKSDQDIFCFQEVCDASEEKFSPRGGVLNQRKITKDTLFEFTDFHAVRQYDWSDPEDFGGYLPWGNDIFVHKNNPVFEYREKFVIGHQNSALNLETVYKLGGLPVVLQVIQTTHNNKKLWILNIHGHHAGSGIGKHDTRERIKQSEGIIECLKQLDGDIILGGDFNLDPDTESIKMLEDFGLRNLIKEYNIPSTRTSFYSEEKRKQWPFADYVFVSSGIKVKSFEVDTDSLVSDHAPMFLEIE
mgnify:CR=1 FL=1